MSEDEIRIDIIMAVARTHGCENPNTAKNGYWDERCLPVFQAFARARQTVSDSAYRHGQRDGLDDFLDDVERAVHQRRERLGL